MAISPTAAKGLLTLGGIGAAGGGLAGGIYLHKQNQTIHTHIKSLSLELISSLDSSKVDAQWNAEFELDKEKIKSTLPKVDSSEKLKDWCSESLKAKSEGNESLIANVKKWCVIGTIEERLSRNAGKSFILDSEDSEWEKIYTSEDVKTVREAIGVTTTQADTNKDADKQKIKDFCSSTKIKKFLAETKNISFDRVEKLCMKANG
ncbi:hypothetical protein HF1_13220 [Mycoplasma haemofelis str. Langford 1]|uniref:Uncharacterized protein n=1 Tax=Mycoplasma haemofelis (strain Langford 1) TaxID=941640 RepID=E8ZJK9_MYCHL|nr:hypothetical protein [Mycoplasma haemofelis]CBY93330.1 hypothetical protein HF1_13220 [Mycoplasma haemofelis str. Langford 1]